MIGRLLRQYIWIVHLLVILFCSYFLAKIINIYIGKALEVKKSIGVVKSKEGVGQLFPTRNFEDYEIIVKRNIFDSSNYDTTCTGPDCPDNQGEVQTAITGEAIKTALPIKVKAVLVVGDGKDKRSSATIEGGQSKTADVYNVGGEETFYAGTQLVQIKPDRIEFLHNGRLEYAELEEGLGETIFGPPQPLASKGGEVAPKDTKKGTETVNKIAEGKYVIDQREIDDAVQNLDKLYTQIRAVPNFQDGKVSGMKIFSVTPGSIFSKLGLQRGDILQKINGIELDVKKGFEIFSQLKDQKSLTLDLVRGGTNQTFEYEIR